jgi:hypothetical protein
MVPWIVEGVAMTFYLVLVGLAGERLLDECYFAIRRARGLGVNPSRFPDEWRHLLSPPSAGLAEDSARVLRAHMIERVIPAWRARRRWLRRALGLKVEEQQDDDGDGGASAHDEEEEEEERQTESDGGAPNGDDNDNKNKNSNDEEAPAVVK